MTQVQFFILALVVVVGGLWLFPSHDSYGYTQAQNFAVHWIETSSPTYTDGGKNLELVEGQNIGAVDCRLCYQFTYAFETDGPHEMVLTFNEGELVGAVTDGTIDELSAKNN